MKRFMFIASALLAFTLGGDRAGTGVASLAGDPGLTPGTVIDRTNVQGFTQFLNPGMIFAVDHGLKIKVLPPERVDWPQQYQQATEQHAAQVSLDQTDSLQNYIAGLPFPSINDGDLKVGVKIAYNWRWGPYIPDEVSFSNLASRTYAFRLAILFRFGLIQPATIFETSSPAIGQSCSAARIGWMLTREETTATVGAFSGKSEAMNAVRNKESS